MKSLLNIIFGSVAMLLTLSTAKAQLVPLSSQYYINTYLGNPAFAGQTKGLNANLSYRKLWNNVPGSPVQQNLTVDYSKSKLGLGLNVNLDKAGLQRQTRVVGTYAYHLPLNGDEQQLHFGLSLGIMNQRLSNSDIVGNSNDPLAAQYNERKTYIDGDFGLAYTTNSFKLEGALPNLKTLFKRDELKLADVTTFYTALSYKLEINAGMDGVEIEPKVVYRGVKGFDNAWDAGSQFAIANKQVLLMAMYHSSKSASFGLGMDYKRKYLINGSYTTQTSSLNNYTNGTFEINVRGRF